MNDHLRQTGRTERMMARAVSLRSLGHAVYILTDANSVRRLRDHELIHGFTSIKVEEMPQHFDWEKMCPAPGLHHPNCVFLVEHHVIERELQKLDEKIMRMQQLSRQLYHLTT
jgi:hypothetical protein